VEKQWFFIFDKEMIELKVDFRIEDADAVDVWRNFNDVGHALSRENIFYEA
jgi:hypothetical protein